MVTWEMSRAEVGCVSGVLYGLPVLGTERVHLQRKQQAQACKETERERARERAVQRYDGQLLRNIKAIHNPGS